MSILDIFKRSEKKAVTGRPQQIQFDSLFQIISGDKTHKAYTCQELVALNKGWVAICNNKNALKVATTPLHLYYNNSLKKVKYTKHLNLKSKDIEEIKNTIQNVEIKQAEDIVEIIDHPFLTALKNVNPTMNYTDMTFLVQSYLGLIGNAYVYVKTENGLPKEFYPLLSENVTVILNEDGTVKNFKYIQFVNRQEKVTTYLPEEIIWFKNYKPGNLIYGQGELEQCLSVVERMNYYDAFENYLNRNYARSDFVVSYKGKYTEKELRDAQKQWYKQFGSVDNAGKPLITAGELDIKTLGFSPRDMQFPNGREWGMNEIAACFGVPEALIKLNSANLASSQSAESMYYQFTIIPKIRQYCEKLNEQVLPMYDPNLFIWYSEKDFLSPTPMTYTEILNAQAAGILTNEEAREAMGYDSEMENSEDSTKTEEVKE